MAVVRLAHVAALNPTPHEEKLLPDRGRGTQRGNAGDAGRVARVARAAFRCVGAAGVFALLCGS